MPAIAINGIRFDPATAERVAGHPGGDHTFHPDDYGGCIQNPRRFDEELYKVPEGYWFVVRPLAPDEARAWIEAHDDTALLHEHFPDEDAA